MDPSFSAINSQFYKTKDILISCLMAKNASIRFFEVFVDKRMKKLQYCPHTKQLFPCYDLSNKPRTDTRATAPSSVGSR